MPCVGAVCGVVWCRGFCCVFVMCCVRVVCACWCVRVVCVVCVCCFVWCVCVCVGVCGCVVVVRHAEKPVCVFITSPCVSSKRSRVYRQQAHIFYCMWACCPKTRERFEHTHLDVLNAHTGGRGKEGARVLVNFLLSKNFPTSGNHVLQRITTRNL